MPKKKKSERQFLTKNFYRLFSQITFHGFIATLPHNSFIYGSAPLFFCLLVNYIDIFSLYFECTSSTKMSHAQDKNKWHQLDYKKLTLHENCQVQCSHLPTSENLLQSCSFRYVDMPAQKVTSGTIGLSLFHLANHCKIACFCYTSIFFCS